MKNLHLIMTCLLISSNLFLLKGHSQTFYSVTEAYTIQSLEEGDTLWVSGYSVYPDRNYLIEFYPDWLNNQPLPPQSLIIITGMTPPDSAWNGGFLEVGGIVSFTHDTGYYYPEDSVRIVLDVFAMSTVIPGEGELPPEKNVTVEEALRNQNKEECDPCKFAILISGGIDYWNNHSRYWESLVALYNAKVGSQNYCPENIIVHYYHGKDSVPKVGGAPDPRIPQAQVEKADYVSMLQSFYSLGQKIQACAESGKEVTFQKMVFNHGSSDGGICLLGDNSLEPAALKSMQQYIIDKGATYLYDEFLQCYAGFSDDAMLGLDDKGKTTVYINSNADKTVSCSRAGATVDPYLLGKITAITNGSSYDEAVVAGKTAYDTFLQEVINNYHQRMQYWRAQPPSPTRTGQLEKLTQDSTKKAQLVGKSRNHKITPYTSFCEWRRFLVPAGGQLVLDFKGSPDQSGNVTVYQESPDIWLDDVKVREWNWNIMGSFKFEQGNNRRVVNGATDKPTAFKVHNDNGKFTLKASMTGNQDLTESPSNRTASPSVTFGGTNSSREEFGVFSGPTYYLTDINDIPFNLKTMPGIFGGDLVQTMFIYVPVIQSDIFFTDMELVINILRVLEPGFLQVSKEPAGQTFMNYIATPGTYTVPLGNLAYHSNAILLLITPNINKGRLLFEIDSWGLRSKYDPYATAHHFEVPQGWSGISSYNTPYNPEMGGVLYPVANDLEYMYNSSGIYWPDAGIYGLPVWNPYSGYIVKMDAPGNLSVCCTETQNKTLNVPQGWSLIPVLSSEPASTVELLTGVEGFEAVTEVAGSGIYWPDYQINTLQYLMPGKAYYVYMSEPGIIDYSVITLK